MANEIGITVTMKLAGWAAPNVPYFGAYQKALEVDPENMDVFYNLAVCWTT
jgi:hypothetical protein